MKAHFKKSDGEIIPIQFNPSEYSINSQGTTVENDGSHTLKEIRKEELSMSLIFDTYMADEKEDVRSYTQPIVELAEGLEKNKPSVTFIWGSVNFCGAVDSVAQKFTMFMPDGKPVRAELEVKMTSVNRKIEVANAQITDFTNDDWQNELTTLSFEEMLDFLKNQGA
jgi:hypothetical protein